MSGFAFTLRVTFLISAGADWVFIRTPFQKATLPTIFCAAGFGSAEYSGVGCLRVSFTLPGANRVGVAQNSPRSDSEGK
jgi:hypothetical protein